VAGLERRGLHPGDSRRRNRFHTVSGQQPVDALLREIDDQVRAGIDAGAPMVRVLGHLGWGHPGWPPERDILSLEGRVTDAVRNLVVVQVATGERLPFSDAAGAGPLLRELIETDLCMPARPDAGAPADDSNPLIGG
jgi:hypothetical protein